MYQLKKWYLEMNSNGFRGHGNCYDNPNFFNGDYITTSYAVRIEAEEEEERLKLFTQSGSCYMMRYEDISEASLELTKKVLESRGIAVDLQKCVALKRKKEDAAHEKIKEILKPNELYVVMPGGLGVNEAYFKTKEGNVVAIPVKVHTGRLQNSVIVSDWENGLCDWRIFPAVVSVKLYHWSDYLEAVRIENVGESFMFEGFGRSILCKSGEITVIRSRDYTEEDLTSTDAVNRKHFGS